MLRRFSAAVEQIMERKVIAFMCPRSISNPTSPQKSSSLSPEAPTRRRSTSPIAAGARPSLPGSPARGTRPGAGATRSSNHATDAHSPADAHSTGDGGARTGRLFESRQFDLIATRSAASTTGAVGRRRSFSASADPDDRFTFRLAEERGSVLRCLPSSGGGRALRAGRGEPSSGGSLEGSFRGVVGSRAPSAMRRRLAMPPLTARVRPPCVTTLRPDADKYSTANTRPVEPLALGTANTRSARFSDTIATRQTRRTPVTEPQRSRREPGDP
jgi:hypothetical protein